MKRIKVGIIGLGDIAQKVYLPLLVHDERIRIVGIMTRNKTNLKQLCEKYHIKKGYTDVNELLLQDLDAVFVHSSTDSHYQIIKKCLNRNLHVYVDKPLSNHIKESMELVNLAEQKQLLLCVGFNRRFAPQYIEAKNWMDEVGGFDTCIVQKHRTQLQNLTARHTIYDDLIHIVDLLLWIGAGVKEVSSYTRNVDKNERLLNASGHLIFGSSSGFFSMNRQSGADIESLELNGGGRSVKITNMEQTAFYDLKTGEHYKPFGSWDTILYRRGFVGVVDHFLETLHKPETCTVRAEQVLETHLLMEQLSK
ncbi:Gfo/Idh/MocA family protein [Chengkuizengella axinellae]|uniref:Gfo/Idh/MocA family oxidoreductase n=1 Tax=Chengkuizengella axinellae TaxID=3064388 RepID=A0ABT9J571_9BACL|nr:Gfo/Idh/MocA family oxidoreductase [Chengkuizengella sp. 2205SS18-9]MDP5276617.1 Gfo/Idh/MocA family oxidoreductase [Chengkuizengella sp. 2205SS18-9]